MGAVIRVLVPVGRSGPEAEKLADDFAKATVPPVMQALRNVRGAS
jgi:hypothetical protein